MHDLPETVAVYLNDHLAGARGALKVIDDILEGSTDEGFVAFLRRLRAEIDEDHHQLLAIMQQLGVSEQRVKQVLASLAGSTSQLKLARAGQPRGMSHLLELEALSGGIWTKTRLWRSLRAVPAVADRLDQVDLDELIRRGEAQLEELEQHRLDAARDALSG